MALMPVGSMPWAMERTDRSPITEATLGERRTVASSSSRHREAEPERPLLSHLGLQKRNRPASRILEQIERGAVFAIGESSVPLGYRLANSLELGSFTGTR